MLSTKKLVLFNEEDIFMKNKTKRIGLLFDSLRSPYDIANILQVAIALDCDIYTSGNCIDFKNRKILGKVNSWKATSYPMIVHFDNIETAIEKFHSEGKKVYGTSPNVSNDFYELDFVKEDIIIAFGSESHGLSKKAMNMMDGIYKLPMKNIGFLTLSIVTSAVAYEINRQIKKENL